MEALANPGLTVALALACGIIAQILSRHLHVPGIVLLLAVGVAFGPDGLGLIWPETLGSSLFILVSFAVAVILFEGGMSLSLDRIKHEQRSIRQLITLGALITAALGALTARLFLGWDIRLSILFGTLIMVTGPTVVGPLLRRIQVTPQPATVLEAEGILGVAIGAITAAVALEVALQPSGRTVVLGPVALLGRLGFGLGMGLLCGVLFAYLLRLRKLIPAGLESAFLLSLVLAMFQASNAMVHETGIAAAVAAGVVVGNFKGLGMQRDLYEFKEQVTVMLIGLVLVLLAADVRIAEVAALGWPGVLVVLVVMLVVRPAAVMLGTMRTSLSLRQKIFMSWIGPRGIVAAALASFFAVRLEQSGIAGGDALRALVFLVIAVTVVFAGLTGGMVAGLLGLKQKAADPSQEGEIRTREAHEQPGDSASSAEAAPSQGDSGQ